MRDLLEDMAQELSKLYKDGSKVRIRCKRSPNLSSVGRAVDRAVESTAVMATAPPGVPQALKSLSASLKGVAKTLGAQPSGGRRGSRGGGGGGGGGSGGGSGSGGRSTRDEWALLEERTKAPYEHLAGLMRAGGLHVPQVRNFKLTRSLYHVSSSLTMVALAELCWSTKDLFIISSSCCAAAWTTEFLKQQSDFVKRQLFKVLGFLTRDGEQHTVNSAT